MKLLTLATMTLATFATTAAFAAKNNTEYYFQPQAGGHAVELKYNMNVLPRQTEAAVTGTVTDDKEEINDFNLSYAYGLNESNTLGAYVGTGNDKYTSGSGAATTSSTASGMSDFHLFYEGSAEIWHYGVDLGIATEKKKVSSSNVATNRSTGGPSIKPWVGVMMNNGSFNYGADLSYAFLLERSVEDAGGTKLTEGNTLKLAPFVEYNYGFGFLGAELSYAMSGDTKATVGSSSFKLKGETVTGVNLFGSFDFNEMATGLLTLGMNMHGAHDQTDLTGTAKVKGFTETVASLGVRLNF